MGSDDGGPVAPTRLDAAKEAAKEFVEQVDDDIEVGLLSFAGSVDIEVDPTLDRDRLDVAIDGLELAESTAIGDALATGTRLLTRLASDVDGGGANEDLAPGAIVLLTDGTTTVGRPTQDGGQVAADADIPVFTIAFGTATGTITDPASGQIVPVPVEPRPLESVSELTGGTSYEAATTTELSDAYERIRDSLGDTLGEEIETVTELTSRWAAIALALLAAAWSLALWWLRGMSDPGLCHRTCADAATCGDTNRGVNRTAGGGVGPGRRARPAGRRPWRGGRRRRRSSSDRGAGRGRRARPT